MKMVLEQLQINDIEETDNEVHYLSFLAGCVVGEELYFSSWTDKGFYKMDLLTGACSFLKMFEKETENTHLYNSAIHYKGSIWLIPANHGEYLVKICLDTLDIEYIPLPESGRVILGKDGIRFKKFKCCYKDGDPVFWLIPIGFDVFLKVNMDTNQITVFPELREHMEFADGIINFFDACFIADDIWMCPKDSKKLVIFNTKKEKFIIRDWQCHDENETFSIIKSYNDWAVFIPSHKENPLLLINRVTFEEKRIPLGIRNSKDINWTHIAVDIIGQYVLLIPFLAAEMIAVDLETQDVQIDRKLYNYVQNTSWKKMRYQTSCRQGSKILYMPDLPNIPLLVYDLKKNVISFLNKYIEPKEYSRFLKEYYRKDKDGFARWLKKYDPSYFSETEIPLDSYDIVINVLDNKKYSQNKTMEVGKRIFSEVKNK